MSTEPNGRRARILVAAIAVFTVVLLACFLDTTLAGRLVPAGNRPADWTVAFVSGRPAAPEPDDPTLTMRVLLVDGTSTRPGIDADTVGWVAAPRFGDDLIPGMILDEGAPVHLFRFHGTTFVMAIEPDRWHGTVTIRRNGVVLRTVSVTERTTRFAIDDIDDPPTHLVFALGLLCSGLALALVRPWRSDRRCLAWMVMTLVASHLLYWAGQPIGVHPDSRGYLGGAGALAAGFPAYFPPGYPALLGLLGGVGNPVLGSVVTLIQHAMILVMAVWTYRLLRDWMGGTAALLGGLAVGLMPSLLSVSQSIMSETLASITILGTLYFTMPGPTTAGRPRSAVLAGACLGIATITRVVPLAGLAPALTLWYLVNRRAGARPRHVLQTILAALVVIALPISWFTARSSQPRLANSAGLHLYNRVIHTQRLMDTTGPATRRLIAGLPNEDPRDLAFWDIERRPLMDTLGYGGLEHLLGRAAWEGIASNPLAFLGRTPPMAWREFRFTPFWDIPAWGQVLAKQTPNLEVPRPIAPTAAGMAWRWTLEDLQALAWPSSAGWCLQDWPSA